MASAEFGQHTAPELPPRGSGACATLPLSLEGGIRQVFVDYAGVRGLCELLDEVEGDVLGVVIGSPSAEGTIIQRFEPLRAAPSEAGSPGPARVVESMQQLVEQCALEGNSKKGWPIGIFRTQAGGWASISEFDSQLIRRPAPHLTAPGRLFLIIRKFTNRPLSGALFSLDGPPPTSSTKPLMEFPFDESLLRKGHLTDEADVIVMPAPGTGRLSGRKNAVLVGGAVCLAFVIGAGIWRLSHGAAPRKTEVQASAAIGNLSLSVTRNGRDMEISWNRFSGAMLNAAGGTLTIRDGPMMRVVALNASQLREGHVWFAPLPGNDLDLRLEISRNDGRTEAESVQVLGWDSAPPLVAAGRTAPSTYVDRLTQPPASRQAPAVQREAPGLPAVEERRPNPPAAVGQSPPPTPSDATVNKAVSQPQQQAQGTTGQSGIVPELSPSVPQNAQHSNSNPVEQISVPRSVPASPAPPVVEKPNPVVPPASSIAPAYAGPVPIHKSKPNLTRDVRAELRSAPGKVTVSVRLDIDENGNVRKAEAIGLTDAPPNGGVYLKLAAATAARQWRFQPGTINGKKVASQMTIVFEF